MNDLDPLAYVTDVRTRIVDDIQIQLLPWAYRSQGLKAVPRKGCLPWSRHRRC
ncbi:transposase domain-containing protein [Bradyrhizobium sp. SZCCHNPS2010]|uniref:transposase domain-containing protein n=1 Tax=Bradyrhizobium sp. SZCCHNPS2010 TaxID=3057333 RepID=UPI002916A594|nr:transposase domain-containing protein [Bradyrhizobium sp. SZCCHNPS2010]